MKKKEPFVKGAGTKGALGGSIPPKPISRRLGTKGREVPLVGCLGGVSGMLPPPGGMGDPQVSSLPRASSLLLKLGVLKRCSPCV